MKWPPEGYRKYSLGLLALVFSFVGLVVGLMTGEQWVVVCSAVIGLTGFANVGEHYVKSRPDE